MQKLQGWVEEGNVHVALEGPPGPPGPPGPQGPPGSTLGALFGGAVVSACDFPGSDAAAKIQAALAALPAGGGIVDARCLIGSQVIGSTVTIGANQTVLLGAAIYTVTAPSLAGFNLTGNGACLIGEGAGQSNPGTDPVLNAALGTTNLIASALGSSVDMIRIAIPAASRTSLAASILPSAQVRGIYINMGNSGRHGVYATSIHTSWIHQVQVFNVANGGDGIKMEGDISTSSFGATCYHNAIDQCVVQPIASNTTGYGIHLDASHGELAWNMIRNTRSSGNISTGGGLAALFMQTGTLPSQAINHLDIDTCYMGNPANVTGSYGIKMQALGPYFNLSGPTIADVSIRDTLIERLFSATTGTGIGGVSSIGPDVRSGAGIGSVVFFSSGVSANWSVATIDRANMGQNYVEVAGFTNPGGGQASHHISGVIFGANASAITLDETMRAGANADTLFGITTFQAVDTQGHTGVVVYGANLDWGPATGTPATVVTLRVAGPVFGTTNRALWVTGGSSRFDGSIGLGADPNPNIPLDIESSVSGDNAILKYNHGTLTSTGAGQGQTAEYLVPSFHTAGLNPALVRGMLVDMGGAISGGGTATLGIAGDFTGPASGATTMLGIRSTGGIQMVPNIAKPAPSAAYRGTFWVTQGGPGVKDSVEVCAKDATDTYAWRTIY